MHDAIEEIHQFWFGELDARGRSPADRSSLWFKKSDVTDTLIKERFGALLECALDGDLDDWSLSDRGLVALVVLLDQFSRNIHRDTPASFAGDEKALSLALAAIDSGRDRSLPAIHRVFLYMPLEHSEALPIQHRCVDLFQSLCEEGDQDMLSYSRYALAHREVIEQFGRFPHRNEILGRASSNEELQFLKENGGF